MVFLAGCFRDEEKTDSFVTSLLGLIGDFGDTYKTQVRDDLMQEWIQDAIQYGRQRGASKSARNNSQYAQKVSRVCEARALLMLRLSRRSRGRRSDVAQTARSASASSHVRHHRIFSSPFVFLMLRSRIFLASSQRSNVSTSTTTHLRPRSAVQGR